MIKLKNILEEYNKFEFKQTCDDDSCILFNDATEMACVTGFGNDEQSYITGAEEEYLISKDKFFQIADVDSSHQKKINNLSKKKSVYFGFNDEQGICWFYDAMADIHYFYA